MSRIARLMPTLFPAYKIELNNFHFDVDYSGWALHSATVNSVSNSIVDISVSTQTTSTLQNFNQQKDLVYGNTMYVCAYVNVISGTCNLRLTTVTMATTNITGWRWISGAWTSSVTGRRGFGLTGSAGAQFQCECIAYINVTQLLGGTYSKEWCDANIFPFIAWR